MSETFTAAMVQTRTKLSPDENLKEIGALIREAASKGADYVQTPEMTNILAANREGAKTVRQVIRELEQGKDAREVLQSSTARLRELGQRSNDAAERLGVPECVQ